MKKLRSSTGETLVEVLVSIIILALCFVMLQTSIVTSAKINARSKENVKTVHLEDAGETDGKVIILEGRNQKDTGKKVYKTESGYYYYE